MCVKPQAVCASFFYLALPWDGQRNVLGLWVCDVFTKRLKLLTHREPRWFSWTRLFFLWRGSSFFFSLSLRSPFELPLLSYTLPFILISNFYSLLFTVVLSSSLHSKRNKINSKRKEKNTHKCHSVLMKLQLLSIQRPFSVGVTWPALTFSVMSPGGQSFPAYFF